MRSQWTREQKRELARAYRSGATRMELAAIFGRSPEEITKMAIRLGLTGYPRPQWSPDGTDNQSA